MSQFIIGIGKPPEDYGDFSFEALSPSTQEIIQTAYRELSGGKDLNGWIMKDAEDNFSAATNDSNYILPTISELCTSGREFWLWYGSDWAELPLFREAGELIDHVSSELSIPSFEVYAHFKPKTQTAEQTPEDF